MRGFLWYRNVNTLFVWSTEQGKGNFCCNGILLLVITEYVWIIVSILQAPFDRI